MEWFDFHIFLSSPKLGMQCQVIFLASGEFVFLRGGAVRNEERRIGSAIISAAISGLAFDLPDFLRAANHIRLPHAHLPLGHVLHVAGVRRRGVRRDRGRRRAGRWPVRPAVSQRRILPPQNPA